MAEIGRNELCPCGSGKKYKKCCMGKENPFPEAPERPLKRASHLLTYEKVHAQSTEDIILTLRRMGIPFMETDFLKEMETHASAQEISEKWFEEYSIAPEGPEEDFPFLAAWILWERLAPAGRLSMEQITDLYDSGIEDAENNNSVSACDKWLHVWEAMKEKIRPSVTTLAALDKQYMGFFFTSDFCQEMEMELHNAGLQDPAYFEKRIEFCYEFCRYFPEAEELVIHNMRRAAAEAYAELGDYEQADAAFEKLVHDFRHNPWGYIGWGDIYFSKKKKEYHKAQVLYEKGREIAKDKIDKEILDERLKKLK